MNNSFLHPLGEVHFDNYKPEDAKEAVDEHAKLALSRIIELKKITNKQCSFETVILGITRAATELELLCNIISHLEAMHSSAWETADTYATRVITQIGQKIEYDKKLYKLAKYVQQNCILTSAQKRITDELVGDYEANGIALPIDKLQQLKKLERRHTRLATRFRSLISKERSKQPLIVKDINKLKGIPASAIKQFKKDASVASKAEYLIKINDSNFDIVMTNCEVESTRADMHRLYMSAPSKKNSPIMFELLELRWKMAEILGYETPSHLFMRKRMLNTPRKAIDFLEDLDVKYMPKAKQEYNDLLKFVQKEIDPRKTELQQYDYDSGLDMYITKKYYEYLYKLNLDEVSEYLEFNNVRSYMLEALSKLYGIGFVRRNDVVSWHDSVEVYDIVDSDGSVLSQAHCDWFTRDDKHGHAWMNEFCFPEQEENTHMIGCVVMNLTPPSSDHPCLMSARDVGTMWHEFGHFIHYTFVSVQYPEQRNVKRDFVEAPSQIMENWPFHPSVLQNYARHYITNEPIAPETADILRRIDLYNVGIKSVRQHYLALLDLYIHSAVRFTSVEQMIEYGKVQRAKTLPGPMLPWHNTFCTFGHIASDYISGYYTYKWSDSLQADMFSRFENEGVLGSGVGNDYRRKVLQRGGEVDPDILISDFLGRDPQPDALLTRDGIVS